jgi:hypothetical protein
MNGGTTALNVAKAGNVTINAPTSGTALTLTGAASSTSLALGGSGYTQIVDTVGTFYLSGTVLNFQTASATRLIINANGDIALNGTGSALATNATHGFTYLPSCAGIPTGVPGSTYTGAAPFVWDSTHGVLMAYGTMSTGSAWWNVAGVLQQNVQSGNYTLALSDNGGTIYCTNAGAQTITIPANSATAFPIGATITILNAGTTNVSLAITTDTLVWGGNGGTGTRTLSASQAAVVTITKVTATKWNVTGVGLA